MELTGGDFFKGNARAATLGVSCLFVYLDKDGYKFTSNTRSSTGVAVQSNRVHTLPAGMFQTEFTLEELAWRREEETSIEKRIMCEWLEEVYGRKEYKDVATKKPFSEIKKDPDTVMPILEQLRARGKVKMFCSGIAIDLFNLRPEICMVLIITEYNEKIVSSMRANEETRGKDFEKRPIQELTDQSNAMMAYLSPENTVATGMAAIWKGLEIVKRELGL
jgi:hypothetical protein